LGGVLRIAETFWGSGADPKGEVMRKVKQQPQSAIEQHERGERRWTDAELRWVEALEDIDYIDNDHDKKPLTRLLRSDIELSPLVRDYLADLIDRRCVPLDRRHKRLPAYHHGLSPLNWHYMMTHQEVDAYRQEGLSLDDAIEKAATKEGLNASTLRLSYSGKHTSFRRARKTHGWS
jgi:hypothetical protein